MNIGEEIVSQLLEESTPIIALYPGKFKPPHAGHFDVVTKAAAIADKVIMLHNGRVQWSGDIKELEKSQNPYLNQFLKGNAEGPIEAVR